MAVRGRKPKPTHLHIVQGTHRGHRHGGTEPDPGGCLPKAPSYLPALAKRFWSEVAPILTRMGVGTEGDRWSLESMAMLYYRARKADEVIMKDGATYLDDRGNPKRRPEAVESLQCWKELRLMFNEAGLTPSARARLKGSGGGGGKAKNPFLDAG